jgi:prolyl-tRNA synthetase
MSVKGMTNFITGANKKDAHLINVNIERDFETKEFADLRKITKLDKCPACGKAIEIKKAIEVGHTFKLGTKYSEVLGAKFLDVDGKEHTAIMGCYGIGVNRIIASLIETSNDKDGIIWPLSIAPYQVIIVALNTASKTVKELADDVYARVSKAGYEVLYDDRDISAGIKFKDADLIGIPVQIIIGEKNAKKNIVEIKTRKDKKVTETGSSEVIKSLKSVMAGLETAAQSK